MSLLYMLEEAERDRMREALLWLVWDKIETACFLTVESWTMPWEGIQVGELPAWMAVVNSGGK